MLRFKHTWVLLLEKKKMGNLTLKHNTHYTVSVFSPHQDQNYWDCVCLPVCYGGVPLKSCDEVQTEEYLLAQVN